MDWVTWKQDWRPRLEKYKYVFLILLVGILLMVLPEGKRQELPQQTAGEPARPELQQSLSSILSRIAGAGRVEVLLTEAAGQRTVYQADEDLKKTDASEETRRNTVLLSGSGREETGLIRQILPPTYQGAIVLCQGAGDARVKLAIVQAVMSVTGLSADKITVLKMK